jgi:hypothetical protein
MAQLPQQFNTADLPDTGGKTVNIPAGKYQAVILASDYKDTRDKAGKFLELKIVLTQGEFRDTEFIERLNIINNNPKAVEIAYKTLARISEAVNMTMTPRDSTELHNKPFLLEVKTIMGDDWTNDKGEVVKGKEKSEIKAYHKLPPVGGVGGFAPSFTQSQPAAVVEAQSAPSTPPWAK